MILPMPGGKKKKKRSIDEYTRDDNNDFVAKEIFYSIIDFYSQSEFVDKDCEGYIICRNLKLFAKKIKLRDVLLVHFLEFPNYSPFLSMHNCARLFPTCQSFKF